MNASVESNDPYAVVLADLVAKRDQIDAAIAALEALRGLKASPGERPRSEAPTADATLDAGAFLGLSIPEATKKLLTAKRRALSNADIARELKAGGLAMNSIDPVNTISSVLTRRFKEVGDIVRVERGIWGLAAWYPGRSFKKANGRNDATAEATTSPSEPPNPPAQDESAGPG